MTYLVITQKRIGGEASLITFRTFNTVPEVETYCKKQNWITVICRVYEITSGAIVNKDGTFTLKPMKEMEEGCLLKRKSTKWKLVSSDNKYTYSFETMHPKHRLVDYIYAAPCLDLECTGRLKIKNTEKDFICSECGMESRLKEVN